MKRASASVWPRRRAVSAGALGAPGAAAGDAAGAGAGARSAVVVVARHAATASIAIAPATAAGRSVTSPPLPMLLLKG
jgi:hypothetical protein